MYKNTIYCKFIQTGGPLGYELAQVADAEKERKTEQEAAVLAAQKSDLAGHLIEVKAQLER